MSKRSNKTYIIVGEPVAKATPAYNRYGGTYGKSAKKQKAYEKKIADALKAQDAEYTEKAIYVKIRIYKSYLKSWTKKQLADAKAGRLLAVKRPDVDNYVKSIMDGAEGILFKDDSQMVHLDATKEYGEPARVEIEVREINHALSVDELKAMLDERFGKIEGEITIRKETLFDYLDEL